MTDTKFIKIANDSVSKQDLLNKLNLSDSKKNRKYINNKMKELDILDYNESLFKRTPLNITKEIVKYAYNFTEVLKVFGKSDRGANIYELKKFLNQNNIDYTHFNNLPKNQNKFRKPLELFKENSSVSTSTIKNIIKKLNLIEYKCESCGQNPIWNGKELVLILDHINGINNDNRLKNLRFVCPNCDSQSDTFCSRNKIKAKNIPTEKDLILFKVRQVQKYKFGFVIDSFNINYVPILLTRSMLFNHKILRKRVYSKKTVQRKKKIINNKIKYYCSNCETEIKTNSVNCIECNSLFKRKVEDRPSLEQLKEDLLELGSYVAVGKKYNVSDNAVRKWIKEEGEECFSSSLINFEKTAKEIEFDFKSNVNILSNKYTNYRWINKVRVEHKKGTLSKEKQDIIKKYKLPLFETKSPQEILDERKKEYISFVKKNGRKPTTKNVNEKKLVQWLGNTKKRYPEVYEKVVAEIRVYLKDK